MRRFTEGFSVVVLSLLAIVYQLGIPIAAAYGIWQCARQDEFGLTFFVGCLFSMLRAMIWPALVVPWKWLVGLVAFATLGIGIKQTGAVPGPGGG